MVQPGKIPLRVGLLLPGGPPIRDAVVVYGTPLPQHRA